MKNRAIFVILYLMVTCVHSGNNNRSVQLERVEITNGLKHPWDIAFVGKNIALVTEKEGSLQKVNLSTGDKQEITGLPDDIDNIRRGDPRDNSGLFGIALDPQFNVNNKIYLSYASRLANGLSTTRVISAQLHGLQLVDVHIILTALPYTSDRFHYGGGLVFGGDDKLYITVGERLFKEEDQPNMPIAQDVTDQRGKIYRINTNGTAPKDNPNFDSESVAGLYAIGIRASQGITKHPKTHELWFSEHGSIQGDEINVLSAGANYGWPIKTTGTYRSVDYRPPNISDEDFTSPVWSWGETVAPTGLSFYYGKRFPEWHGSLLVAGLSKGSLWRFTLDGKTVTSYQKLFIDQPVRLRSVQQGLDGEIYLLTDESNGRLLRIE